MRKVNALLEFGQFDTHVARALGPTCAATLGEAYAALDRTFDAGYGDSVKRAFNASNLIGTPLGTTDVCCWVSIPGPLSLLYNCHLIAI